MSNVRPLGIQEFKAGVLHLESMATLAPAFCTSARSRTFAVTERLPTAANSSNWRTSVACLRFAHLVQSEQLKRFAPTQPGYHRPHHNTLPSTSQEQCAQICNSFPQRASGLTLPSSGLAFGQPLKSNVRHHKRGGVASRRSESAMNCSMPGLSIVLF